MNFKTNTSVVVSATIEFNEAELRALDALIGYGADPFLEVFYEHMGKAYMEPNEDGLRSLFETLKQPASEALRNAKDARSVLSNAAKSK